MGLGRHCRWDWGDTADQRGLAGMRAPGCALGGTLAARADEDRRGPSKDESSSDLRRGEKASSQQEVPGCCCSSPLPRASNDHSLLDVCANRAHPHRARLRTRHSRPSAHTLWRMIRQGNAQEANPNMEPRGWRRWRSMLNSSESR